MSCYGVIVAAGRGTRFGSEVPKQFVMLAGKPMLAWSLLAFEAADTVDHVVVVADPELQPRVQALIDEYGVRKVSAFVPGGAERIDSVANGVNACASANFVAIHDAARPLITPELIDQVVAAATSTGAALLALSARDTIKKVAQQHVCATLDRRKLYQAQTPQVCRRDLWLHAYQQWQADGRPEVTDDAQLMERINQPVSVVESNCTNFKVTVREDLIMAEALLLARVGAV